MAWHFLKSGLLMPAAVPMDLADETFTEGKYDFQVRGRVESHLRYFMDDYMEPGTFHDEIQLTPKMDYNVRFYTTREAYADAIRKTIMEIDYEKFKPMAEEKNEDGSLRYKGGAAYHSVLNAIWGNVTRLGSPGGYWGTAAAYKSSMGKGSSYKGSRHTVVGTDYVPDSSLNLYKGRSRSVGDTFFEGFDEMGYGYDDDTSNWDMDYTPDKYDEVGAIVAMMDGIPVDQWEDYLTDHDFELVKPIMEDARESERRDREYIDALLLDEATEVTVSRKQARKERRAAKRRGRGRHHVKFSG